MAPMVKKKVLLMGKSGSGKTSMRNVIFQNTLPTLTHRLGATIDVEQSHQRFLGSLILNLWDCGGQGSFLDGYLSSQRATIFAHVGILIYVFDAQSTDAEWANDFGYLQECLKALNKFSPHGALTFVLIHKMDLIPPANRQAFFEEKRQSLMELPEIKIGRIFATSIWDETLYKAWSHVVHALIPNANQLSKSLSVLRRACGAVETAVFERTTLLLIGHCDGLRETSEESNDAASTHDSKASSPIALPSSFLANSNMTSTAATTSGRTAQTNTTSKSSDKREKERVQQLDVLTGNRFERISSILKIFKLSVPGWCGEQWTGLSMRMQGFTVVIEPLTSNSYVLVLVADDKMTVEGIKMNIRMAHDKFEDLQAGLV